MMAFDRRALLAGMGATGFVALVGCGTAQQPAAPRQDNKADEGLRHALATLEAASGGKFGAAVLDCRDSTLIGHRIDTRFTMCSTFKLPLVAAVFERIDAGGMALGDSLPIAPGDPVGHSPVVRAKLANGARSMTVLDLCDAAQTQSDNGAANILLRKIGGPATLTAYWRSLGDAVSRLDRYEPELNTSHDGDPLDTTTPAAMAGSLRAALAGNALKPASRDRLIAMMIATQTGLKRLRAGFPTGWRAGDKTGTNPGDGSYAGKINDVAICWHPGRAEPFLITAFLESAVKGGEGTRPQDEAVLAEIGRIAGQWIIGRV